MREQNLKKIKLNKKILVLIFLIGFLFRFYISLKGFNYDYGSWKIVGEAVVFKENIYTETTRYSYGPIWAIILGAFRLFSFLFINDWFVFRFLIIFFLTIVDFFLSFIVLKHFGLLSFLFIFFNPILLYTSGFHNQFDNFAILIGLISLIFLEKNRKKLVGYLLLGLSIATKHIFLFYPLWLFLSSKDKKERILSLVPLAVFGISFFPFLNSKKAMISIMNNVFLYKRDLLYPFFVNNSLVVFLIFLISTLFFFFAFRKERLFHQGLWYLLIFSGSIVNLGAQYLAIPLVSLAINPPFFLLYTSIGAIYLFFNLISLAEAQVLGQVLIWLMIIFTLTKRLLTQEKVVKAIKILILVISLVTSFLSLKTFYKNFEVFLKNEKARFWSYFIYKNPARIFYQGFSIRNKPINEKNLVRGSFIAKGNNLGFLIIPASLDQQSDDFFKKDYKIKMQLLNRGRIIHEETRSFGNALVEEGIIFGLPLIKNSQGKKYELLISTDIPIEEKSFFLNFDRPFQEKYFLTRSHLNTPSLIFRFIFYKFFNFIFNKNFIQIFFQAYFYFWFFLLVYFLKQKKEW